MGQNIIFWERYFETG